MPLALSTTPESALIGTGAVHLFEGAVFLAAGAGQHYVLSRMVTGGRYVSLAKRAPSCTPTRV